MNHGKLEAIAPPCGHDVTVYEESVGPKIESKLGWCIPIYGEDETTYRPMTFCPDCGKKLPRLSWTGQEPLTPKMRGKRQSAEDSRFAIALQKLVDRALTEEMAGGYYATPLFSKVISKR